MAIITENIRSDVQDFLKDLRDPVTVDFYPQPESPASEPMKQLLQELHELAPLIQVVEHPQSAAPIAPETAEDIEGPVTTFSVRDAFTGIRYLGFPGGQEFGTFLQDLVDLSVGQEVSLSTATQQWLKTLEAPLHLEVFVTPT
ncbi:MAG: hypothetical protein C7B45_00475 [Sulfobacillus acidophilus]|uniref:Uncharacterized protein n=1 Tax=Sulfobacillus acidophilus TaxID=53633 RepID=A0A2T2WPF9_9FIRM|nr:MAG: hypothetical protein C7B45_00475 [Sulfobacillus acidophilus]